ncbi:MAG TPA: rhomboid family intramembrane serine protease [bacterium]|nr:rhomboid family intramembrane serine protease [bacterium]
MSAPDAVQRLARRLALEHDYVPLGRLLGPNAQLEGGFDAVLARWEGRDLRVHALLADLNGDPGAAGPRAEGLRLALRSAEGLVRGRLYAGVWVLCEDRARARQLGQALFGFEDGHFLSKTLVGRGVLSLDGEAAWEGRAAAKPSPAVMQGLAVDPAEDPGEAALALRLEKMDHDERTARRMLKPAPSPLTWALIVLNVAAFSMQWMLASQGRARGLAPDAADMDAMLRLGANEGDLTLGQHQYWRILASAFLHGGIPHIAMNMLALFSLGSLVERLAGPWRMAGLYLAAALAAGLFSALLNPAGQPSLGASGAILGLAGVLLAPRWRRDPRFPQGLALRLHQWLARSMALLFGVGLALALLGLPVQLDNAAHFGGLLCGFAIGYLWPSFLVRSGPWKG